MGDEGWFGGFASQTGAGCRTRTRFVPMPAGSYIAPSSWADNRIIQSAPTFLQFWPAFAPLSERWLEIGPPNPSCQLFGPRFFPNESCAQAGKH